MEEELDQKCLRTSGKTCKSKNHVSRRCMRRNYMECQQITAQEVSHSIYLQYDVLGTVKIGAYIVLTTYFARKERYKGGTRQGSLLCPQNSHNERSESL